jgi:hypothetical protein
LKLEILEAMLPFYLTRILMALVKRINNVFFSFCFLLNQNFAAIFTPGKIISEFLK